MKKTDYQAKPETQRKANTIDIIHAPDQSRFYSTIEGTEIEAELLYEVKGSTIDFYRTFVPPEARGGKVAYKLVQHGVAWAEEQDLELAASCWYVEKYLAAKAR